MKSYDYAKCTRKINDTVEEHNLGRLGDAGIPQLGERVMICGNMRKIISMSTQMEVKDDEVKPWSENGIVVIVTSSRCGRLDVFRNKEEGIKMTLKEAVKFKRPIKRRSDKYGSYIQPSDLSEEITIEDALADDWVVEEKKSFTRLDVLAAIKTAIQLTKEGIYDNDLIVERATKVAEETDLGEETTDGW